MSDWREIMGAVFVKPTHNPQNPSPENSSADIAYRNKTSGSEVWQPGREQARSLIQTCKEYGVGLRLEPDGTLVVESNGRAWRSLVDSIEANFDAVAELVQAGWDGSDG